jgi:hypothetical protein
MISLAFSQAPDHKAEADALKAVATKQPGAVQVMTDLIATGGPKAGPEVLIDWSKKEMQAAGLDEIKVIPGRTPEWVRGASDSCFGVGVGIDLKLDCSSIPGSPATSQNGLIGSVIQLKSLAEAKALGTRAKGAILFFNAPASPDYVAGNKFIGAQLAISEGASGVIIRSTGNNPTDTAHPGSADFDGGKTLPVATLSLTATSKLANMMKSYPDYHVEMLFDCKMFPPVPSSIVTGQITGSSSPNDVVLLGGHLDSVNGMMSAKNDGVGAVMSLEALHLLKEAGWKPKKTIRVAIWVDEARGGSGASAFAATAKGGADHYLAAAEADQIGFNPRGVGASVKDGASLSAWQPLLSDFDVVPPAKPANQGGGNAPPKPPSMPQMPNIGSKFQQSAPQEAPDDADVALLKPNGVTLVSLDPKSPRSFNYHRSDKTILAKMNAQDIEMGAASLAMLAWLISEDGIK